MDLIPKNNWFYPSIIYSITMQKGSASSETAALKRLTPSAFRVFSIKSCIKCFWKNYCVSIVYSCIQIKAQMGVQNFSHDLSEYHELFLHVFKTRAEFKLQILFIISSTKLKGWLPVKISHSCKYFSTKLLKYLYWNQLLIIYFVLVVSD